MKWSPIRFLHYGLICQLVFGCGPAVKPPEKDLVSGVEELNRHKSQNIEAIIQFAQDNSGRISDSSVLKKSVVVLNSYAKRDYKPVWSLGNSWHPGADTLINFIRNSARSGLYPYDYHLKALNGIRNIIASDSISRQDAILWARADLLMTDAAFSIAQDLKVGRFPPDTLISRKTLDLPEAFYDKVLEEITGTSSMTDFFTGLEPTHTEYLSTKDALKRFLDSADFKRFTYIPYPVGDSALLIQLLQKRLFELDFLNAPSIKSDTAILSAALRSFQEKEKLKITGLLNEPTALRLNMTDSERFKLIALTMDKMKWMPDTFPSTYVWVNIPSYLMKVVDSNLLKFRSRIIVGTPKTPTPELNSEISDFMTYPQWTVPYSIVFKEMLPQIQKNPGYLDKQNLMVVDKDDNILEPTSIDWNKLNKNNFPYQIKQRQGDNNSLGILKFNFRNPYSVYLHDTNARWLFSRSLRAMSHGCVRVQQWQDLVNFLVRNDTLKFPSDTIQQYLVRKEKRRVAGFTRVPIYIRYYTCEAVEGKIRFYEDIYSEDKLLREKYFSGKYLN